MPTRPGAVLDKMLGLIDGRDDKAYNRDLFAALGGVYFDQTLFDKGRSGF